jgi:hypothetical protein
MTPARRPGRLTAWIAIFAILLAALAPSVASAVAAPQQVMPWTDICAVAGAQAVPDATPVPGSGQHQNAGFKHCPLCLTHAGHVALPTAPLVVLPEANSEADAFPHSATLLSPRVTRAATQPRAPPANS